MIQGQHLIAGCWVAAATTFASKPIQGPAHRFAVGTPDHVDAAVKAAEEAFWSYGYSGRAARAAFLNRIADEIDARGEAITEIGCQETGLPEARLVGERGRTVGQLRLFASHIEAGAYLDRRYDAAQPDRTPLPRPDLRLIQRPVGPVAVFGASNFPLAFSVAGGDTASALAAGCPVVVKGHPAHPGTGEIMAQAIEAAIVALDLPAGLFSLIQADGTEVGAALAQHPLIKAVGFTGSLAGGRALFDLCARRPEPIPFFGELGSINPMFVMPAALAARGPEIARGWAGSLTMGAGQFCTNPGLAILPEGPEAEAFTVAARETLAAVAAQNMLTEGIASAYREGVARFRDKPGIKSLFVAESGSRSAAPSLFSVDAETWLADGDLAEEVFGPLGLLVRVETPEEMRRIAQGLQGQLTCTLQMDAADTQAAKQLMPILERKAGRLLANGFPTGVEVCDTMVHGGPYPASTNFGATSVGTMAIRRFLRPVCYQNMPIDLLPEDLAEA
ncbi:aldehyde dehydrogenase (NADP(+)) [Algihabitans albus]|uniref:aldehyde dehydrogenase (NADP(+)) n=1 Tax=Algihabitans albus TaxID=2164067 RepID=UPI000E5D2E2E|nr:aldehyde dehydrogenase (NADP(+)) [Algihabitans albus]